VAAGVGVTSVEGAVSTLASSSVDLVSDSGEATGASAGFFSFSSSVLAATAGVSDSATYKQQKTQMIKSLMIVYVYSNCTFILLL
jgi:hypothetical protein